MQTQFALEHARYERELDRALAGSFPASDPPPWTFGVTHSTDFDDSVFAAARPAAVDVVIGIHERSRVVDWEPLIHADPF